MKSKRVMKYGEIVEVGGFIKANVREISPGYVEYVNDLDDDKVAAKFGVSSTNVANLRSTICGLLAPRKGGSVGAVAIEKLEQRVEELSGKVKVLELERSRLETDLRQKWDYHFGKMESFKEAVRKLLDNKGIGAMPNQQR